MCEINKISFILETSFNMYNLHNSQIMLTHIFHILYKNFGSSVKWIDISD